MENHISRFASEDRAVWPRGAEEHSGSKPSGGPQPIGAVLAELLAQYQTRFPEVHIVVVETPTVAI